jgi:AbrB family looped-hinge helix DNA binding protein
VTEEVVIETVTISPKFQIVIPKTVREQMRLVPGQQVHVLALHDRIEFIPVRPARELRGMLRGLDTSVERDDEDRV